MNFVFVGEKRSDRAIEMGVRWADGRLAGRTLSEALEAAGIDVEAQRFVNLFRDGDGFHLSVHGVRFVRQLARKGWIIVGMGKRVQAALVRLKVEHRELTHPAARGRIRRRDRYHAHVAVTLGVG